MSTPERHRGTRLGHAHNVNNGVDRLSSIDEGKILTYNGATGEWEARTAEVFSLEYTHLVDADDVTVLTDPTSLLTVTPAAGVWWVLATATFEKTNTGEVILTMKLTNTTAATDVVGEGCVTFFDNAFASVSMQWIVTANGTDLYTLSAFLASAGTVIAVGNSYKLHSMKLA